MALPDGRTMQQLLADGFKIDASTNIAKRGSATKSICDGCGLWWKQTRSYQGSMYCNKCSRAIDRADSKAGR